LKEYYELSNEKLRLIWKQYDSMYWRGMERNEGDV
jgi:hypothetical protein